MAGVVPFSSKSSSISSRKHWNIRDKRSVRRLRSQLAEDGCPESQLVLAKQLLQEKSDTSDNEENARLGVFWLMQASEQGSEEATQLLQACLDSGEGITEHNYLDIKACLNTSLNEKLARRAAREIFVSLSAGQDFITTEQLRRQIDNNNLVAANIQLTSEWNEHWGEKLTEDHLEEAASNYSRGELPLVQHILAVTDPQRRELSKLSYLRRSFGHPLLSIKHAYGSLLDFAWKLCCPRLYGLLIIIFLTPFESLLTLLPMAAFYASFFFMVVSTLQMLHTTREYRQFRNWSRLFLRYDRDGHLNTEDPEFVYTKKNLRPYGIFFLNLLLHLATYPLVSSQWIPQSEFAVLSFLLTFTTLLNFSSDGFDFLQFLSFGLHVLAKYPYESDGVVRQTWRLLDFGEGLPCFASHVVGNGVEFCLNFRGIFYLMIPGIFIKVAARQSWRGTYKFLIPHCVTLAWWQMAVISCQGATLYGLIRSTLAMVGLVLLVPVISIAGLVVPALALVVRATEPALTPISMTTSFTVIGLLAIAIFLARYPCRYQLIVAVLAASILLFSIADKRVPNEIQLQNSITWDEFSKICRKSPFQSDITTASVQDNCLYLSGTSVNWEAVVYDARIIQIYNPLNKLFEYLPDILKSHLSCMFGSKYETNSIAKHPSKCHLMAFNKYELEISLRIESSTWFAAEPVISLIADDTLKNFTLALRPKDIIWFRGLLKEPVLSATHTIQVSALEMGCVQCQNSKLVSAKKLPPNGIITVKQLQTGIFVILNFIFNPVIIFH